MEQVAGGNEEDQEKGDRFLVPKRGNRFLREVFDAHGKANKEDNGGGAGQKTSSVQVIFEIALAFAAIGLQDGHQSIGVNETSADAVVKPKPAEGEKEK